MPDLTLAEVLAAFDRAVAEITATRTQAAADGIDLDAKVPVNNPWMPKDFDMSVRWILAHLNTEIARHAGHADIIRESIDGAVSYQLNAQAEGRRGRPRAEPNPTSAPRSCRDSLCSASPNRSRVPMRIDGPRRGRSPSDVSRRDGPLRRADRGLGHAVDEVLGVGGHREELGEVVGQR
ncbi:DUF664 domain-containing protein [Brevibacterium casei]|nr:DUF664 domain-containing protein [Brevibacterium casei]